MSTPFKNSDIPPKSSGSKRDQWSDRELHKLAIALQKFGSADVKRIANFVKTKSALSVQTYLRKQKSMIRNNLEKEGNSLTSEKKGWKLKPRNDVQEWSNARKWQKIAENQIMTIVKHSDYSKKVLRNICRRFFEEAEDASSEVVDIKAMYIFMLECITGRNPSELPPVESALMLMLIKQLREMRNELDFKKEVKFMRTFEKSTQFSSFKVKDEFMNESKETQNSDSSSIPIPRDVFLNLRRHRKVVQSFNPLTVPMWLLSEEQMNLT